MNMNKNRFFTLLTMLLTLVAVQVQETKAQEAPLRWKASLGAGASSSEAMSIGFAKAAQVTYSVSAFEFGLSLHHTTSQTLSTTKRHGQAWHLKDQNSSIQISQADKDHNKEQHSANTSSVNLYAGVNFVKLFTPSSKHSAVLGVLGGIGLYDSSKMSSNGEDMSIDLLYGSLWSYGARAAYEYMITERVGAGLSATYDLGQDNFYGLANLIIRF